MRTTCLLLATTMLVATACKKDDPPAPAAPPAAVCGVDGARLQATFNDAPWCADLTLFADGITGTITISGMTQMGSTLTLELEDTAVGTHAMREDRNSILFTTLASAFSTSNDDPGTLTITTHDTATRRLRGTFTANVYEELGGTSRPLSGNFDVQYIE